MSIRFQEGTKISVVLEVEKRCKILPLYRKFPEHARLAFFFLRDEAEEGGVASCVFFVMWGEGEWGRIQSFRVPCLIAGTWKI